MVERHFVVEIHHGYLGAQRIGFLLPDLLRTERDIQQSKKTGNETTANFAAHIGPPRKEGYINHE